MLLAFLVAVIGGSLLQVRVPSGRHIAPVVQSIAIGLAFGSTMSGLGHLTYHTRGVIVVCAAGCAVGAVLRKTLLRRPPEWSLVASRVISVAVAAVLYRDVPIFEGQSALEHSIDWSGQRWRITLVMFAIGAIAVGLEIAISSLVTKGDRPFGQALVEDALAVGPVSMAVVSTGVAIALGLAPLGLASIVLMVCPLLMLHFTIRQQANVRSTRRQTIAALSRLTEVAGYTPSGHARRVAELSVQIGRNLRLPERDIVLLEDAALLHDIGQVYLVEPIPGGATVEAAPMDQRHIAHQGAEIVRRTEALDDVATIMESQSTQYRNVQELGQAVPLASRIIKVCNAYDDLTRGEQLRRDEAVERLYLGLGYEYDPEVLDALVHAVGGSVSHTA